MSIYDKSSLVLIPSGTKTGKVFSQKPVSGDGDFTFTRASAATRVNADGNIEKETGNLLLQSNAFDTTWTKHSQVTLTSGQSGYDGTNDAWLFEKAATSYRWIRQTGLSNAGVQTLSAYVKAGTLNEATLYLDVTSGGSNPYVKFNLTTGAAVESSNEIESNSVDVGNGWWRLSMTINGTIADARIYAGWSDAVAGNIYIQDTQLEQGLVARDVITTTTSAVYGGITDNTPRLDYTDSSCPALLLEPQRTNLATLSEHIGGWGNKSNATQTSNYTTSPEGVKNATRVVIASSANGYLYNSNAPTQVIGAKYTLSCYAKRNDSGTQSFGFFTNGSGVVNSAMALTSEWKRFDYTYTASTASQLGLAGVQGADVSVYGFQVEKDADYPTSYIPTYGSSVSRVADVTSLTSAADLIGQTEGTIYSEVRFHEGGNASNWLSISSGNPQNWVFIGKDGDDIRGYVRASNSVIFSNQTFQIVDNAIAKVAIAYKSNDVVLYINGTQMSSTTNSLTFDATLDSVYFGSHDNGITFETRKQNQVMLFKTRLSNEELADLTTI